MLQETGMSNCCMTNSFQALFLLCVLKVADKMNVIPTLQTFFEWDIPVRLHNYQSLHMIKYSIFGVKIYTLLAEHQYSYSILFHQ